MKQNNDAKSGRNYEMKLSNQLLRRDDFLLKRLKTEWDEIEGTARREEIVRKTKDAVATMAKAILALLAIGGALSVAVVAPNMFVAFGRGTRRRGFFQKEKFIESTAYLQKSGRITVDRIQHAEKKMEIKITASGRKNILRSTFNDLRISKTAKWDCIWRVVAFDIPNTKKWSRDSFRQKLKLLGFFQLQRSLFVIPYPCEGELRFVMSIYNVETHVSFIQTHRLDGDSFLKKHFAID